MNDVRRHEPLATDPFAAPTWVRHQVVADLCVAAIIAYVGRNCLGVATSRVQNELGISTVAMGWVMGAFFWSYALGQIPAGWVGQLLGTRRALACYATAWSLACATLGLATGFWTLVLAQLLFGFAQAGIFPCAAATISKWTTTANRSFATGVLAGSQSAGGALGNALAGVLLSGMLMAWTFPPISWRWVFVLYAVPGILWAANFFRWFRDRPEEHPRVNDAELALIRTDDVLRSKQTSQAHVRTPWGQVLGNFDMWMIFGQQFFRAAGYIFFATWFPTFLKQTRGVTLAQSGYLTAIPLLAVVFGSPCGGLVVDAIWKRTASRRASRQAVAIFALLSCATCIGTAYFVSDALLAVLLISAGSFLAGMGGPCGYTATIDKSGAHVAPIFGAMNMAGNIGAALCPVVVAWIAKLTNWNAVLVFFAAIYLSAAICWMLMDPEGTIDDGNDEQLPTQGPKT